MKTQLTLLAFFTAAAIAFADEHADQGHVAIKHKLTLQGARKIGDAAATMLDCSTRFQNNSRQRPILPLRQRGRERFIHADCFQNPQSGCRQPR